ncbi:hypothetical protein UO65_3184 [Actinokineospora spheciospongiae]|uniref:Uncharacterized protein n=1 Tax=Actinokineospora spheciospongiae TaxID=909613 RepID=W7IYG4_9PSEU|nr:hypothetical protein [Actinokineospora spheciospongiae]EWC61536.1 hypothetical protein UO65_3184 [Actinokineospora spheciospongiae]PWW61790.1 hypothetical protein DFQ13_10636 [Actinokineospora spheciospongiae]
MDVAQYAAATEVARRLAGRLSDDVVAVVQAQYAAGEPELAVAALLLNLVAEGVAVTAQEATLIRSLTPDPTDPALADLALADTAPAPAYRFSPTGPPEAPDPTPVDEVLATEAPLIGARRVRRAWRDPLPDAPNRPTWVYLVQVAPEVDELRAYSTLTAHLWMRKQEKWPVEVIADGGLLPPYQAAAVTAARQIWAAA